MPSTVSSVQVYSRDFLLQYGSQHAACNQNVSCQSYGERAFPRMEADRRQTFRENISKFAEYSLDRLIALEDRAAEPIAQSDVGFASPDALRAYIFRAHTSLPFVTFEFGGRFLDDACHHA